MPSARCIARWNWASFFDTAEVYGPFANESRRQGAEAVGDKVVIATKFGFKIDPSKSGIGAMAGVDGRPEHAREVAEASLKRLGVEAIDLFYLHRVDPQVPIEDTVGAMASWCGRQSPGARALETSADTLRRAHAVHPIAALRGEYSLWTRDPEGDILDTCRELGIGFVSVPARSARGFLTGTIQKPGRSRRHRLPAQPAALQRGEFWRPAYGAGTTARRDGGGKGRDGGAAGARQGDSPGATSSCRFPAHGARASRAERRRGGHCALGGGVDRRSAILLAAEKFSGKR